MYYNQLVPYLKAMIEEGEPILVSGPPGGGKTTAVQDAVKSLREDGQERDLLIEDLAIYQPIDLRGIGAYENGEAFFLPVGIAKRILSAKGPTVVLFDDVLRALPSVQSALMPILQLREINGEKIPDGVTFVMCTNRREDKAGVGIMNEALKDRVLACVELEFDVKLWRTYMLTQWPDDIHVAAFANFKPDLISSFKPSGGLEKQGTPRTWDKLTSVIAMSRRHPTAHLASLESFQSVVGKGNGNEFWAFYKTFGELPSLTEIYLNPATVRMPASDRPDILHALMMMLAAHARKGNIEETLKYLDRAPRPFQVFCAKDISIHPKTKALVNNFHFQKWWEKNADLFGFEGGS